MERRVQPRYAANDRIWFESGDVLRYVAFKDVSLSGAQVETLSRVVPGAQARIRWQDAERGEIAVDARVVWTKGGSDSSSLVGVVFERVHTPEPLTNFIRKREIETACALVSSRTSTPTSKP